MNKREIQDVLMTCAGINCIIAGLSFISCFISAYNNNLSDLIVFIISLFLSAFAVEFIDKWLNKNKL